MTDAIPSAAATPGVSTPTAGQATLLAAEPTSKNKKKKKKGKS